MTNSLPEQFIQRLQLLYPTDFSEVLETFNHPRKLSIRVNTLKSDKESLQKIFIEKDIQYELNAWYGDAFIITRGTSRELTDMEEYKNGFFYIQNLSSMIPALVLDPQPGERILDIAAAPGSKTTQIAALMKNEGEIVANDISRQRMYKLEQNLRNLGVTNVKMRVGIGEKIWQTFTEYFDKTLVDAPCSMEGRFNTEDPTSYADWSMKKVKKLAKQQQWLLRSAVSATKPGGTIVYSTCTLAPEENEGVIQWLLEKEKGKVELESIKVGELSGEQGVVEWMGKKYGEDMEKCLRVRPTKGMEGFFVARLRKNT